MSLLSLLSWTLLVLVQVLVQVQTGSTSSSDASCPSCALARLRRSEAELGRPEEEQEEQEEVVEAVKRHILNMLHLTRRPNITRPVPRAALLNAIRKLHVGRVDTDGSVTIGEQEEARGGAAGGGRGGGAGGESQETTEIITFAEPGDPPGSVSFVLSKDGGGGGASGGASGGANADGANGVTLVDQANVWLFLRLAKTNRSRAKVSIRLFQQLLLPPPGPQDNAVLLAEKTVATRRSGWHTFPVTPAVQALLDGSGSGSSPTLRLGVSCPLCADAGATLVLASADSPHRPSQREQSHRPFLMAAVRPGDGADDGGDSRRRRKRGLECDGKVRVCCKRQFNVNFKDIGWDDWIIAPPGYHANYCEGECPSHMASVSGSSLSFHSTVISHYRLRGHSLFQNLRSCCVPTRLAAMSMLYYNEEQRIIKKDIQNMIVEECGCS